MGCFAIRMVEVPGDAALRRVAAALLAALAAASLVAGARGAAASRSAAGSAQASGGFAGGVYTGVFRIGTKTFGSTWEITVTSGRVSGTSHWTCCPGARTDRLTGSAHGSQVTIVRICTGQGVQGACAQTHTGTVAEDGRITGTISGSYIAPGSTFTLTPKCLAADAAKLAASGGDVLVRSSETDWQAARSGMFLCADYELSTGPDGGAAVTFPDGGRLELKELTRVVIGDVLRTEDRIKIQVLLKLGEVKAQVPEQETIRADFSIKSPTATASVRDTAFSVSYDPASGVTAVAALAGTVVVDPAGPAPAVAVVAGHAVTATARSATPVPSSAIKAQERARKLVLARATKAAKRCRLTVSGIGVTASGATYSVTVQTSRGAAVWAVSHAKAKAANALARQLDGGSCPAGVNR